MNDVHGLCQGRFFGHDDVCYLPCGLKLSQIKDVGYLPKGDAFRCEFEAHSESYSDLDPGTGLDEQNGTIQILILIQSPIRGQNLVEIQMAVRNLHPQPLKGQTQNRTKLWTLCGQTQMRAFGVKVMLLVITCM